MSLPAFQTTVVNGTGDILTAATVTVTVESTGAAAVLFSDRNGTIGLGSGGVFSVNGTTAFAQFFAAPGEYRIEANDAVSGFSETWRYQVLAGTASLANKQTSSTDTTAGALMAVGAFGIGTENTEQLSDLDTVIETSITRFSGAQANRPFNFGTLFTQSYSTSEKTQTATGVTADQISYRRMQNGTWSAWQLVYTGANYQPSQFDALGYVLRVRNLSGSSIANGATVSGTLLRAQHNNSSGGIEQQPALSGQWIALSGVSVANNMIADFSKVSN